jgi:CRISPR-associated exonuclease Cas4
MTEISPFFWKKSYKFQHRIEHLNLHGLHFQHIELCSRRAWMYLHKVNFAQWYSRVATGSAKHAVSYQRDHSVRGLMGLSPDRIDWKKCIVYENKGTAGAVEASSNQTAFYALILSICTEKQWQAFVHILSTRRKREIILDEVRLQKLWDASLKLEQLMHQENVPKVEKIPLCRTCSFAIFCGH